MKFTTKPGSTQQRHRLARNEAVLRRNALKRCLSSESGPFTVSALAKRFRTTQMTMRRDLRSLEADGLPVIYARDGAGTVEWRTA